VTVNKRGRLFLVAIALLFLLRTASAQPLKYSEIFGSDWLKAMTFVEENNSWIKPALAEYGIPYHEAIAVVFPELVRYSALRDKMEITLLKTLYRNLGEDYADFSIGVFQVKPSFAEHIRVEASRRNEGSLFERKRSYANDLAFRTAIVKELEDPQSEFNYVIAFFKICEKKFKAEWTDEASKIKFLATAYNTGFWKSAEDIEKMSDKKFFNTKLFKTENYSYSEVSLFWYNQYNHAGEYQK
jgi:hypothetical protein